MIFLDSDGVIVRTMPVRHYECKKAFHPKSIPLIPGIKGFLKELRKLDEVKFCSKTMFTAEHPHTEEHIKDKMELARSLGFKDSDIIIGDASFNKYDLIKNPTDILLDDYGKNCEGWKASGGIAIQMFEEKKKAFPTARNYADALSLLQFFKKWL